MTPSVADSDGVLAATDVVKPRAPHPRVAAVIGRLAGTSAGQNVLALSDQAVVSATSFVTAVLIGRWAGPEQMGIYALGLSILVFIVAVQDTLITLPYTIYGSRVHGRARAGELAHAAAHSCALGGLALVGIGLAAGASAAGLIRPDLAPLLGLLAVSMPFVLLRELARRVSFADLKLDRAILVDAAVAGLQLGALGALVATGTLSGVAGHAALAAGCAVAGLVWLWRTVPRVSIGSAGLRSSWRRNWRFGRWAFASRLVSNLNSDFVVLWVLAAAIDATATGVFAACMTIVAFSNPFVLAAGHVLTPRAAHAMAQHGRAALIGIARQATLAIGAVMGLFWTAVLLFGNEILLALYGSAYAGQKGPLVALVSAVLVSALAMGSGQALLALERPDINFKSGLTGAAVTALSVTWLVGPLGVGGAALGLLGGASVDAAIRIIAFHRLARNGDSVDLDRLDAATEAPSRSRT